VRTQGATFEVLDILAVESDPARCGVDESNNSAAKRCLATAAFADQSQGLSFRNVEAHAIDRFRNESWGTEPAFNRVMDFEIAYLEQFHGKL
jgi:hypothetical protein